MDQEFDLERYLSDGVEDLVKGALRTTLKDPRESLFIAKYALASKEATRLRRDAKARGEHIPPFLIASITSSCNLHCAGCYSRANQACEDREPEQQLTDAQWLRIFEEAKAMGIGFILLAGGEPMLRRDVLEAAGRIPEIVFPVFTNGTLMNEQYLMLFNKHRNLIPVFSIEGHQETTEERRGIGVYQRVIKAMEQMKKSHIMFGASVTVTKSNLDEVTSEEFLNQMSGYGCKLVFYIEYVPVSEATANLAPGDEERELLNTKLALLRQNYDHLLFISFPGDEKSSGGCLAAGRGFFHINSHGGAEPCPFSPYSDINVANTSLKEALRSKLFTRLRDDNLLLEDHAGGCVLFDKREKVEALLQ